MLVEVQGTNGEKDYFGSAGNDAIDDSLLTSVLKSTANDNTIYGRDGDDFLDGGAGVDTLSGGEGNDTLVYDATDSTVDGGYGIDTLIVDGNNIDSGGV